MKRSISAALLCSLLLTACASRATYHEDVSSEPSVESCLSEEIAESAESVEPTAEAPARTSEIAGSAEIIAETPTNITAEVLDYTEEVIGAADDHGNPGLEPGAAFEFNGERYFFELPADLAVISEDGSLIEWRSDVHNRYFDSFGELEDVSDNAVLNEFESGKWYLAPDGKLLHLRQVTQAEYDSMTGFGADCPPDKEYLLGYDVEDIYNAIFYAPA